MREYALDEDYLNISQRCRILGLPRSTFYYKPVPVSPGDLEIMAEIDKIYTESPSWGARTISHVLKRKGYKIGRKHTGTLMGKMGLQAICPKRNTSKPHPGHKIYPYLLRGVRVTHKNQVFSTDITYIRLKHGFVYLVAVMDWFSRYVLSWRLSTTLDSRFCCEALQDALAIAKPEVFNTDQGAQFTCEEFTGILKQADIQISMDGRGRALDNVFVERLWRTVKYDEVYLNEYESVYECRRRLGEYFRKYNERRPHKSLGYRTPAEVYHDVDTFQIAG